MLLRLFRAPELAFWSLAVLALGATLAVAAHLGSDPERAAAAPGPAAVASNTTSQTSAQSDDLIALMPAGVAAGTDPSALTAWAGSVQAAATTGASTRTSEGATSPDDLLDEFTTVSQLAAQLEQVAADPVAATATRTQIGLHVSRIAALVDGMPAPALPAGSTDLFSGTGREPAQPTAPPATVPDLPTVPTNPNDPTLTRTP